jgi:hypothetical protein
LSRSKAPDSTFSGLKNRMGLTLIRCRGLAKVAAIALADSAFNFSRWATLTALVHP